MRQPAGGIRGQGPEWPGGHDSLTQAGQAFPGQPRVRSEPSPRPLVEFAFWPDRRTRLIDIAEDDDPWPQTPLTMRMRNMNEASWPQQLGQLSDVRDLVQTLYGIDDLSSAAWGQQAIHQIEELVLDFRW